MSLLGDDGRGFELARKLETVGAWRMWLGDSLYSSFVHFLSSPSSWDSFMRADDIKSKAQIHLQLRTRALLFDKATVTLFLSSNMQSLASSSFPFSKLNPNYLQLHGDDVYYTLDDADQRREGGGGVAPNSAPSKIHSRSGFGVGPRYSESEKDSIPQRFSLGNRESDKRSPEEMSTYLKLLNKHKKRRSAFTPSIHPNSVLDGTSSADDDVLLLPETVFMLNSVPDSALPLITRTQDNQKIEFCGVFDTLPQTRSSVVIERLGISLEQGGGLNRGKNGSEGNRRLLGSEQASQMSQKVVARMLARMGFEGASEVPVEVLSQMLRCHIGKLGRTLKVLSDSYRKQCSAIDLLKMFLQTSGYRSNLGALMELVKDGTRNVVQPTPQQMHAIQAQMQAQQQSNMRIPQQVQIQRQQLAAMASPQMQQQMTHPQNLAFQPQHLERMRRRQSATPRPAMDMDKDRPLVQVKLENPSELPMDGNAFSRNALQLRQQQLAATMTNFQAQSSSQFRQLTPMQAQQLQAANMSILRAPPVKVEGFQELMGGDASLKHESDENKLRSPSSK
ncbi:hypothetical protein M5689_013449 [Euphorbia peplus]|nr:hypothetical protein M5689_013449 [Euphorbia peplus]